MLNLPEGVCHVLPKGGYLCAIAKHQSLHRGMSLREKPVIGITQERH